MWRDSDMQASEENTQYSVVMISSQGEVRTEKDKTSYDHALQTNKNGG